MSSIEQLRNFIRPWWHRQRSAKAFRKIADWVSNQTDFQGPVLYDVGARWGISPPYNRLSQIPGFRSVSFEPDPAEAAKLRTEKTFDYVYPMALGARMEKRTLHIAKDPGSSSIYHANPSEFARHTMWREFETVGVMEVPVEPLDNVISKNGLPPPDYMKIDCEGAEGEILEGASSAVPGLCGLTFEGRLRNLYREETATLFQLVDRMYEKNFVCLRLNPVEGWFGALMMFDAVMVRHPKAIRDRRQFILCVLFCLLHGNWLYARRTAEVGATHFGCSELLALFEDRNWSAADASGWADQTDMKG